MKINAVIIALVFWAAPAWAAPDRSDFMSLKLLETKRVADGGQIAEYELRLPEGAGATSGLEVFYRLKPWNWSRAAGPEMGTEEIYTPRLYGPPEAPRLTVYGGRPARLEVMAGAVIDGRFYLARTFLNLYGQSGRNDPSAQRVAARPDWPEIDLAGGATYYRPQTGEELRFSLNPVPEGQVEAKVVEDGAPAVAPTRLAEGLYSYTPPPYPPLAAPSYSVTRDLVFVAESAGGILSYYLPVGRSRYGHVYMKPGLLTVAVSALITLAAVMAAGRRFKWR